MPTKNSYRSSTTTAGWGYNNSHTTGYGASAGRTWSGARNTAAGRTTATAKYPTTSPKFRTAREECETRIGSYRNVWSQFNSGSTAFSPTNANKWVRYVNAGGRVFKFTNQQFTQYFGYTAASSTPTAARQILRKKFGAFIKDVTVGNNGAWLVATTKNVSGRPFTSYNW